MKPIIPLDTHNILDYVGGAVLLLCPYLFGLSDIPQATNVFLTLGLALIGYSLFTNYRYSVAKVIPLGFHMTLDVLNGIVIMLAPWLFRYRDVISGGQLALHFVLGIGVLGLVTFTKPKSERDSLRGETEFKRVA